MPGRRPFGVIIIGGFFTFLGGFSTLVLIFEIIDSIRFFGVHSLMITSPAALLGFLLYGSGPLLFYSTGIGLLTGNATARWVSVYINPVYIFLYSLFSAFQVAQRKTVFHHVPAMKLMLSNVAVFSQMLFFTLVLIAFLVVYLNKPDVKNYFDHD